MAKNSNVKIGGKPSRAVAKGGAQEDSPVEEVELSEEDESVEEVDDSAVEGGEVEHKMVRIAVNREVDPAPRVGNIDMVTQFGMSKLVPGVCDVPEPVALVLIDRGIAQRV